MMISMMIINGIFVSDGANWSLKDIGLTASNVFVMSNKVFQGINGVESGTLGVNIGLDANQARAEATVYSNFYELNLATDITNISELFAERTDLSNIPFINCYFINNMENTFLNCTNLSVESYNTITSMLPNATQLTNKYLSNIGLNVSNFTSAQITTLNSKGYLDAII